MRVRLPLVLLLAVALSPAWLSAAERQGKLKLGEYNPDHASVEMFAAMAADKLEVKFIPKDSTQATLLIKNKTKQPLNVQLPEAFAGLPVLAQFGGPGGAGFGQNQAGGGNQNQAMGGGMMGGGMMGGGGGNFFNVPAEKIGEVKVPCVCLEHGKKDPRAAIPYEIKPLDSFSSDPALEELLRLYGQGRYDQRSAQAAAWHISSKMSWQELAAKQVIRANGVRYPWFNARELHTAIQMVNTAHAEARKRPDYKSPGEQTALNQAR